MRKILLIGLAILLAIMAIGFMVLANYTLPAPTAKIEKPIPDDRLPR